jgi:iron complex transport system substrate-binding protein
MIFCEKKITFGHTVQLITTVILITVLLFTLDGCGVRGQKKNGAEEQKKITVTDVAGRQVEIKVPVKKVVINWSGSGGAFMTMSALLGEDVADYIAAWDGGLEKYRYDMYKHYCSVIPELADIPVVGGVEYEDFNLEKLISLKPDVVIFTLGVKKQAEEAVEAKLEQAGIPLVYIDYHAETIENHSLSTRLLGKLFGKEERAEEMINYYVDNITTITDRLSDLKDEDRPTVYMETGMNQSTLGNTYANNYMWGGMVYKAGGANIAEGIVKNAEPINPETIIAKNPEYIILTGSYWPNEPTSLRMGYLSKDDDTQKLLITFTERPGWSELSAVRNGKVFAIHHGLGRELYDVAAVAFLAKTLHPDLFEDIDPMAMLEEYYNRFLPYDLSGVWMTQLK